MIRLREAPFATVPVSRPTSPERVSNGQHSTPQTFSCTCGSPAVLRVLARPAFCRAHWQPHLAPASRALCLGRVHAWQLDTRWQQVVKGSCSRALALAYKAGSWIARRNKSSASPKIGQPALATCNRVPHTQGQGTQTQWLAWPMLAGPRLRSLRPTLELQAQGAAWPQGG